MIKILFLLGISKSSVELQQALGLLGLGHPQQSPQRSHRIEEKKLRNEVFRVITCFSLLIWGGWSRRKVKFIDMP